MPPEPDMAETVAPLACELVISQVGRPAVLRAVDELLPATPAWLLVMMASISRFSSLEALAV